MIKNYSKLLRVKHYIKNLLIFFPLVFSRNLLNRQAFFKTLIGLAAFSLSASIVYIINDINDVEKDRRHPTKCLRPIASGAVSMRNAKAVLVLLCILVVALQYAASKNDWRIWAVLTGYIASNLAYSLGAKNIALLDVFILVLGYILRIYYGAMLIGAPVSSWLYLTVLSMAAFLGFGKRRNELRMQGDVSRKVLGLYTSEFLDKAMYLCLCLTIVFYALWCEDMARVMENQILLFSVPLVLMICMRYSMDVEGDSDGDPVEVVLADKPLLLLTAGYALMMAAILYGGTLLAML